ncbi:hypothetical protein GOODEAATRI_002376 [Goodea atripinnis]|uniref:Uncharacterized protein n=1 Tax=Goodea atripinnis TaxID=208336 RepID=A0ABV0N7D7_9TELE
MILRAGPAAMKEFAAPPPLLFRKLSNPDLSPAATTATKSKLHRQLSQDESRARRSSLAMTGNLLLQLFLRYGPEMIRSWFCGLGSQLIYVWIRTFHLQQGFTQIPVPPVSTGKQLLPLSCSLHAGVSQLALQGPSGVLGGPGALGGPSGGGGDGNNLVRMRSQVLGQSAPSLTGLVSTE